jgi:hypothetical protein
MRRVVIESPFRGEGERQADASMDEQENRHYAQRVGRFLCKRGDAPYASHLLITLFLDDTDPQERQQGIDLGLAWGVCAQHTVVAVDRGISVGMEYGIEAARAAGRTIEWLQLVRDPESKYFLPRGKTRKLFTPEMMQDGDSLTVSSFTSP